MWKCFILWRYSHERQLSSNARHERFPQSLVTLVTLHITNELRENAITTGTVRNISTVQNNSRLVVNPTCASVAPLQCKSLRSSPLAEFLQTSTMLLCKLLANSRYNVKMLIVTKISQVCFLLRNVSTHCCTITSV